MSKLDELLSCGVPKDLANQIREEFDSERETIATVYLRDPKDINRIEELVKENDILRAIVAKSDMDCIYCGLPKKDMFKCRSGFPGCGRADDELLDPRPDTQESTP